MPTVTVGDINLYYEDEGRGEVLALISGITCSARYWFRQIPVFSKEYRVIAIDNRGTGRSDKPEIPYTADMMAADIAGLLDAIGVGTAHVFGHSMGGMIAQHVALDYPDKVQSLILGATTCGGRDRVHGVLVEDFQKFMDPDFLATMSPQEILHAALIFKFTQEFIDNNPALIERHCAEKMSYPPAPYVGAVQIPAAIGHDTCDRLHEIRVPTLVMTGDADGLVAPENSRVLAARLPNAELVILHNVAHSFPIEVAEETNKIVLDFLRKHSY